MNQKITVVLYDASLQKLASSFHSGNDYLDRFLRVPDSLDDNIGRTYVLAFEDRKTIIGYYNLGVGYIEQIAYRLYAENRGYKAGSSWLYFCDIKFYQGRLSSIFAKRI